MPLSRAKFQLPPELMITKEDPDRYATVAENSKYDNLFCYLGLSDDDFHALDSIDVNDSVLLGLILITSLNGYKFGLAKLPDEDAYRATLTGGKDSPMPLHVLSADGTDPTDSIVAVYYKAIKVGFPNPWRTKVKEQRTRRRFS